MFDELGQLRAKEPARARRGVSALLSVCVFASLASGLGAALASHDSREAAAAYSVDISFAALPVPARSQPTSEPEQSAPAHFASRHPAPNSGATRVGVAAPRQPQTDMAIDEAAPGPRDDSAHSALAASAAVDTGPPASAPVARDISIVRPRFVSGCRAPQIPDALPKTAATIEIDVRMLIGADGHVSDARVIKSHPLIPNEIILECVRAQVFAPAHLPDGTTLPFAYRRRFVFHPA